MKINTIDYCKPRKQNINFASDITQDSNKNKKLLYKHFYEMGNDDLAAVSILKAHKQVQNSPKMHLFKSLSSIGTAVIATSLALIQPGKLSSKLATGLAFLAFSDICNFNSKLISNVTDKNQNKKENKVNPLLKTGLVMTSTIGTVFALLFAVKKGKNSLAKYAPKISAFIKKESGILAKELNTSKIGKFNKNTINKFVKNNPKAASNLRIGTILTTLFTTSIAQLKLADSLSKDVKNLAQYNFAKGKTIQKLAREHFDSVEAVEV